MSHVGVVLRHLIHIHVCGMGVVCVAGPLPWHTDFCALDVPEVDGNMGKLHRDHYLHKLVHATHKEHTQQTYIITQKKSRAFIPEKLTC